MGGATECVLGKVCLTAAAARSLVLYFYGIKAWTEQALVCARGAATPGVPGDSGPTSMPASSAPSSAPAGPVPP